MSAVKVSAIVPTIGRPESLCRLFKSLLIQSRLPDEVIVADASDDDAVGDLVAQSHWQAEGLKLRYLRVRPPNAVRQRHAAIALAASEFILLLDDDVVLEPQCVEQLYGLLQHNPEVVAVTADFNNQSWSQPTRLWRLYLRIGHGLRDGQWQGKVIGPLLRFGYCPVPAEPVQMEWLGAGNSLIRESAFKRVGGFSDFFLCRSTMNEDVDLGIKLHRLGTILLCPTARMGHFHAAKGRVSTAIAAEDDLYNRYMILRRTLNYSASKSFALVIMYFLVESVSSVYAAARRAGCTEAVAQFTGRLRAVGRVLMSGRNFL